MEGVPAVSNVDYYEALARDYTLFFANFEASMEAEGMWLDRTLRREAAVRVMDACCGSGRQAIPLAERGYDVTAADPSSAMLGEARRQAELHGVDLALHRAAFAELPARVGGGFDAAIALGNGLCHLERRQDIVTALSSLRACLRCGAPCIVGIKDFDAIRAKRPRFHPRGMRLHGGAPVALFEVWDYDDPILLCTAHVLRRAGGGWSVHSARTQEYMLGAAGLVEAGRQAGFERIERLDHPLEAVYALR